MECLDLVICVMLFVVPSLLTHQCLLPHMQLHHLLSLILLIKSYLRLHLLILVDLVLSDSFLLSVHVLFSLSLIMLLLLFGHLKLHEPLFLIIIILLLLNLFLKTLLHFKVFVSELFLQLGKFMFDFVFTVFADLFDYSESVFGTVYFLYFMGSLALTSSMWLASARALSEATLYFDTLVLSTIVPHPSLHRW